MDVTEHNTGCSNFF